MDSAPADFRPAAYRAWPHARALGILLGVTFAAALVETGTLLAGFPVPAADWAVVALVAVPGAMLLSVPQALVFYLGLGFFAPLRVLRGDEFRAGFSAVLAASLLPVLIEINIQRPGFSLSTYHAAPYLLGVGGCLLSAVLGGALGRRLRVPGGRRRVPRLALTRRRFAPTAMLVVGAFLMAAGPPRPDIAQPPPAAADPVPQRSTGRPNVLLISVDTLRADHLGIYGYERNTDPRIRQHLGGGAVFRDAVSPVAKTRPAHAAMLTGAHPVELGLRWNDKPLPESVPTLAEILGDAGYQTAASVAAWPLFSDRSGLDRGFDVYLDTFTPILAIHSSLERLSLFTLLRKLGFIDSLSRKADSVTDDAIEWLDRSSGEPFFLFVHYYDPHSYYEPPREFAREMGVPEDGPLTNRWVASAIDGKHYSPDASERDLIGRLYDAEIRFVDHEIGRLLDRMQAKDILDDTIVVLTADHGETLFERVDSHAMAFEHGNFVHERDIRVPLVVRLPGGPAEVDTNGTASLVDVTPTILGRAGIAIPDGITGRDLFATAPRSEGAGAPVISINSPDQRAPDTRIAARQAGFKYTVDRGTGAESLVDVRHDFEEATNLMGREPARLARLRAAVAAIDLDAKPATLDAAEADRLRALGYLQ